MPGTHAKWSPSGSPYWYNNGRGCPARVLLPPKEETSSPAAEEGTRLHNLAESILSNQVETASSADLDKIGEYIDYVTELQFRSDINVFLEAPVQLAPITGEEATGSVDCLAISETYLEVVDLKTGAKRVDATSNQLKMYAAAAILEMGFEGKEVICTIHQGGEPHSVVYSVGEVLAFADDVRGYVYQSEQEADAGHTRFNPSENNCQWCPHVVDCKAQAEMRNVIAANDFAVSEDPVQLADELAMTGPLQKWIDEVKARALKIAESGGELPGYKLVRARANRKWVEQAEEKLVALLGDAAYSKKLIGLTAADKLLDAETMNELTIKPEGKPTLAPEDDPRPAINDAAKDFS